MDFLFLIGCLVPVEHSNGAVSVEFILTNNLRFVERLSSVSTSTTDDMQATCCLSEESTSHSFYKFFNFMNILEQEEMVCKMNKEEKELQVLHRCSSNGILSSENGVTQKDIFEKVMKNCSTKNYVGASYLKNADPFNNCSSNNANFKTSDILSVTPEYIGRKFLSNQKLQESCDSSLSVDLSKNHKVSGSIHAGLLANESDKIGDMECKDGICDRFSDTSNKLENGECSLVVNNSKEKRKEMFKDNIEMHLPSSGIIGGLQTSTESCADLQRLNENIVKYTEKNKEYCVLSGSDTCRIIEKDEYLNRSLNCLRNTNTIGEACNHLTEEEHSFNGKSNSMKNIRTFRDAMLNTSSSTHLLESDEGHFIDKSEVLSYSKTNNEDNYSINNSFTCPTAVSFFNQSNRNTAYSALSFSHNCNSIYNSFSCNVNNVTMNLSKNSSTIHGGHSAVSLSSLHSSRSFDQGCCGNYFSTEKSLVSSSFNIYDKESCCLYQMASAPHTKYCMSSIVGDSRAISNDATTQVKTDSDAWWRLLFNGNLYDPDAPPSSAFPSLPSRSEITHSQQKMMCEDTIKALGLIRPEWKRRDCSRPYWWHRCNLAPHTTPEWCDILPMYTDILKSLFSAAGVNMRSKKLSFDAIVAHLKELEYISVPLIDTEHLCALSIHQGNSVIDRTLHQLDDLAKNKMSATATLSSALLPQYETSLTEYGAKQYNSISRGISTRGLSRTVSGSSVIDLAEDDVNFPVGYRSLLEESELGHGNDFRKRTVAYPVRARYNTHQDNDLAVYVADLEFERYIANLEPGCKVKVQRDLFFKDIDAKLQIAASSSNDLYIEAVVSSIHRSIEGNQIAFRFFDSQHKVLKSANEFINLCASGGIKLFKGEDLGQMDPQKFLAASYASASRTRSNAGSELQTGLKKKFIGKHRPSPPGTEKHCKCKFSNARAELAAKLRNIIRNSPTRFKDCCANTPDLLHIQFQNARTYQLEILAYLMNVDPWKYATNPQDRPSKVEQDKIVAWYKEAINSVAYNKLVREWEYEQSLLKANAVLDESPDHRYTSRIQKKLSCVSHLQQAMHRTNKSLTRAPLAWFEQRTIVKSRENFKKSGSEHSGTEGSEPQYENEDASVSTQVSSNSSSLRLRKRSLVLINPGVTVKFQSAVIFKDIKKEKLSNEVLYGIIISFEINEDEGTVVIRLNDGSKLVTGKSSDVVLTVRDVLAMIEKKDLVILGTGTGVLLHNNEASTYSEPEDTIISSFESSTVKHERDSLRRKGARSFLGSTLPIYNDIEDYSEWDKQEVSCRPRKTKQERDVICDKKLEGMKYRGQIRSVRMKRETGYFGDRFNGVDAMTHYQTRKWSNTAPDYTDSQQFEEESSVSNSWIPMQAQVKRRGRPPIKPPIPSLPSSPSTASIVYVKPYIEIVFHQGKGRPRTDGKQTSGYWEVTGSGPKNVLISKKFDVKDFNGDKEMAWKAAEKEKERISRMLAHEPITLPQSENRAT